MPLNADTYRDLQAVLTDDDPYLPGFEAPLVAEHPSLGHRIAERVSIALGMCGHGEEGNAWVRFAERFFVDCPCCLFYRGIAVGAAGGMVIGGAAGGMIAALMIFGGL